MPRLLVSVRNPAEALLALEAGAHLIDVKEPDRGALGAPDPEVIAEVASLVDGRVPVSAALGELLDFDPRVAAQLDQRLSFAKIGLAGCSECPDWPRRWRAWLEQLPPRLEPVAVLYADGPAAGAPEAAEILAVAREVDCRALLVDTFDKSSGGLLDNLNLENLGRLVTSAKKTGMLTVLAGSLTQESIPHLLPLAPDYVAVRGAACDGGRMGTIAPHRICSLVNLVDRANS